MTVEEIKIRMNDELKSYGLTPTSALIIHGLAEAVESFWGVESFNSISLDYVKAIRSLAKDLAYKDT